MKRMFKEYDDVVLVDAGMCAHKPGLKIVRVTDAPGSHWNRPGDYLVVSAAVPTTRAPRLNLALPQPIEEEPATGPT